jgi:hypothetical protein
MVYFHLTIMDLSETSSTGASLAEGRGRKTFGRKTFREDL